MFATAPNTLAAAVVPRTRARVAMAIAVFGFALLTGVSALWEIPLPFTPVPITGQTFAVLLAGATLGLRAGAASQLLYIAMGIVGVPFFAGGSSGWEVVTGPTVGYLIGFVAASAVVGRLAEARQDRRVVTAIPALLAGSAVIYLCGMAGLMAVAGMTASDAFTLGVVPFVVGDAIKVGAAGLALPAAWKLLGR
ncbi:MAG: biotin transporter BioY [Acidimicrobiia bacterium]|nr:biotin transporter BioY [Acidimicrobiia bacterium]